MNSLRIILGDQLSWSISSLDECDKSTDVILMCEVWNEATYVRHHKKKIVFLFSAMRHFSKELLKAGYQVRYSELDDDDNAGSFAGEVGRCLAEQKFDKVVITQPGEFRVLEDVQSWSERFKISVDILPDTRFLCTPEEFASWAESRKQLRMEYFYREMRQRYNILMNGRDPVGGQWNYDADNRKPPKNGLDIPTTKYG